MVAGEILVPPPPLVVGMADGAATLALAVLLLLAETADGVATLAPAALRLAGGELPTACFCRTTYWSRRRRRGHKSLGLLRTQGRNAAIE